MIKQVYSNPDIYIIYIPLPNNPLKNLNSYIVKTDTENLLIDTGFNQIECLDALKEGLEELDVDINKTKLFLSHLHSDHTGLTCEIMPDDAKIYMSEIDYERLKGFITGNSWNNMEELFIENGFPEYEVEQSREINPARVYAPSKVFDAIKLYDGDKITVGDFEFTAIHTPGHTPGHMCLYLESEKLMFTCDHVLFDITPNITCWDKVEDSLGNYIKSLNKVRSLDVKTAFPSHRLNEKDFYVRIDELLHHHEERLEECINIIKENPNETAYYIASKMKWSMRGKKWEEFPIQQKWFAVGETLSHINYLINNGKVEKHEKNNIITYTLK